MYNKSFYNKIKISISYTTNFKPSDFLYYNNFKLFKKPNNSKIISRNFFLFLILLKHVNNNSYFKQANTSILVKPNYKKFITLLRAPYRYKLSRHQFMVSRYYVLLSISINTNNLDFLSTNNLIIFINFIKKFYIWFESNVVSQHQVKIIFNFNIKNLFLIY